MRIYIIRHAIAAPGVESGGDDSSRALTPEGTKKMQRIAEALAEMDLEIRAIWTSPLVRARQTAEIIASRLGLEKLEVAAELMPGGDADGLLRRIGESSARGDVALVGHEPDLGALAYQLITGMRDGQIHLKKGAVACIEMSRPDAAERGELLWLLTPKQMLAMT